MTIKRITLIYGFLIIFSHSLCWSNPEMQKIQGTTFQRQDSFGHKQDVTLQSFSISRKMVTVQDWSIYLQKNGKNLRQWQAQLLGSLDDVSIKQVQPEWPAWEISWIESLEYCNWLSKQEDLEPCYILIPDKKNEWKVEWRKVANGYRLPTVAEWQLVSECFSPELSSEKILGLNWFYENNISQLPKKTGELPPNSYGLYDIFGTIKEFCWDYFKSDIQWSGSVTNPTGPEVFTPDPDEVYFKELIHETRVTAGGMWTTKIQYCLSHPLESVVSVAKDFIGIRVVRNLY